MNFVTCDHVFWKMFKGWGQEKSGQKSLGEEQSWEKNWTKEKFLVRREQD